MKPAYSREAVLKLRACQERLVDLLQSEADPEKFPHAAKIAKSGVEKLDNFDRNDRMQAKSDALKTMAMIRGLGEMLSEVPDGPAGDETVEAEMRKAQQDAAKIIKRFAKTK